MAPSDPRYGWPRSSTRNVAGSSASMPCAWSSNLPSPLCMDSRRNGGVMVCRAMNRTQPLHRWQQPSKTTTRVSVDIQHPLVADQRAHTPEPRVYGKVIQTVGSVHLRAHVECRTRQRYSKHLEANRLPVQCSPGNAQGESRDGGPEPLDQLPAFGLQTGMHGRRAFEPARPGFTSGIRLQFNAQRQVMCTARQSGQATAESCKPAVATLHGCPAVVHTGIAPMHPLQRGIEGFEVM